MGNAQERAHLCLYGKCWLLESRTYRLVYVVKQNWAVGISWLQRSCPVLVSEAREAGVKALGMPRRQ